MPLGPPEVAFEAIAQRLGALERALVAEADELALFLAFDRPERVLDRPALARTFFEQRCATDEHLSRLIEALRGVGAYVELFEGELPFMRALAEGRLQRMPQRYKIVFNEIEGGITRGGFQPGRKALVPAVADAYGIICTNAHAYGCALGRHKFHYSRLLTDLGVRTPRTWHFRDGRGWAADQQPPPGLKVIVKSTYENWAVGVTEDSVFVVDGGAEARVRRIAADIGQPVTVQEFIAGPEVGVSVLATPPLVIPPPTTTVLTKAPNDLEAVMTIHDNLDESQITLRLFDGPESVMNELYASAARAFDVLELDAFARFDFRVDAEGRPWLTDVGVNPGIGPADAAFLSVSRLGFDHPQFLRMVIAVNLAARGLLV